MKISFKKLLLGLVIVSGIVAYTTNMSGKVSIDNVIKKDKLEAMLNDKNNKSMIVKVSCRLVRCMQGHEAIG